MTEDRARMIEAHLEMLADRIGAQNVLLRRQAKAQEETARLLAIIAGAIGAMDNGLGTTIPALRVSTGY